MQAPEMYAPREVAPEVFVLPGAAPIPGAGVLAVNAFLIRGREPTLIDTGFPALREPFMQALAQLIDPAELTRIVFTHVDADHLGAYASVRAAAPKARTLASFLAFAKLQLWNIDAGETELIAPGDTIDLGDRRLAVIRPPYYDAPETVGYVDAKAGAVFSSDAYGALLDGAYEDVEAVDGETLRAGLAAWSALDAPWLELTDPARLAGALAAVERLGARRLLSSHLPPARDAAGLGKLLREAVAARSSLARAA